MIAAYGGEENLRKHKSSVTTLEIDLENQGVQAKGVVNARAPNLTASDMTFTALGKKIGSLVTYFDGANGGEVMSFAPTETYSGKRLEDIRTGSDFYEVLNWKNNYKTITVKRMGKVGTEDVTSLKNGVRRHTRNGLYFHSILSRLAPRLRGRQRNGGNRVTSNPDFQRLPQS